MFPCPFLFSFTAHASQFITFISTLYHYSIMSSADFDHEDDSYSPPRHHSSHRGRAHSPPAYYGRRARSPDYHSGGGPYSSGALPARDGSHARATPLEFESHTPFYVAPPPPVNTLMVPRGPYHRPRSVPPPQLQRHSREDDSDYDPDDPHKGSHSPIGKAKHVLHHTFSQSTSGLGVGVLGAIVGGLSAREASLAASRRGGPSKGGEESNKAALISTIVGAAVGGLGANALEKRIESSRKKNKEEQDAWEKKWGKDGGRGDREDRDRDDRGRGDAHRTRDRGRRSGSADRYSSDDDDYDYDDRRGHRRSGSRHRH